MGFIAVTELAIKGNQMVTEDDAEKVVQNIFTPM
jgi:hypothetical protein